MELKFLATNLEDFDKIRIYYGFKLFMNLPIMFYIHQFVKENMSGKVIGPLAHKRPVKMHHIFHCFMWGCLK